MANTFFMQLWHYVIEVLPALAAGFLVSGIINEFIPEDLVKKHLGKRGLRPILYAVITGALLPVCCWGSLPIAVSFHRKGARLGPTLAFLAATPATSISAVFVSVRLLGIVFTVFLCISVILLGVVMGMIGNRMQVEAKEQEATCPKCGSETTCCAAHHPSSFRRRILSILKYAFVDMPKRIGLELAVGLILAAAIAGIVPIGKLVGSGLSGFWAYPFSLVFGLLMYICSTASVPLVHALAVQGMNIGAGMILLMVGPIMSYGVIFVIRKYFGIKVLCVYMSVVSGVSLVMGILFYLFYTWASAVFPQWLLIQSLDLVRFAH